MKRLPPGQTLTRRFPIVGERTPDPVALDYSNWQLTVDGCVARPLCLDWSALLRYPHETWCLDVHCVTGWTKLDVLWTGVPLRRLLEDAQPLPTARYVRFEAYSARNHDSSLPLDFAREHVLLAYACDGAPLSPEHGAPLRGVVRDRYFYKSVKWLKRIELLERDQLGYWEGKYAYHNRADPFREERYAPHPMPQGEFEKRLARRDFRGAVAVMDDQFRARLRGQDLSGAHFEDAQIKGCAFVRCRLNGASFRNANLTACRFVNVDLRNADFRGADLEGVRFQNADLRDADFRGCLLTATRFQHPRNRGKLRGARFRQTDLAALLEGEAEFLRQEEAVIA